ncbi:hypothetical protein RvY_17221 [Ramazzottius varieornatus]|uniref:UDP-glucuronosyltransferase n=1 Tax=Ramazzottius varieornatus TaxID=947166 RepID=A0A1D1W3Q0_RAMVA|nr:hypothetical protein RvY_17221 [Ramazzottius varieornatus]
MLSQLFSMDNPGKTHIICVTLNAFGHIIPMLELAERLSSSHDVTLALSSSSLEGLQRRGLCDTGKVQFYGIRDGIEGELDALTHEKSGRSIGEDMHKMLKGVGNFVRNISTRTAPNPTENSVTDPDSSVKPVDFLIIDNFTGIALTAAIERNIPFYILNTGCAYNLSLYTFLIDENTPMLHFSDAPTLMEYPAFDGCLTRPVPATLLHEFFLPLKKAMPKCRGVIINSIRAFEEDVIVQAKQQPGMANVPFFCVGPLMLSPPARESTSTAKSNEEMVVQAKVKKWLDFKKKHSVVYISFGTIATPNVGQMVEIMEAIKVLRKTRAVVWSLKSQHQSLLPGAFLEEVGGGLTEPNSSVLLMSWVPQTLVLGHKSTSVFVSHCGWNGTLEGLMGGVPFVAWPQAADQSINAEFLEKHGAAFVLRDADYRFGRVVSAEELVGLVEKVAGNDNMRNSARELQMKLHEAVGQGGSSNLEFQTLVQCMKI